MKIFIVVVLSLLLTDVYSNAWATQGNNARRVLGADDEGSCEDLGGCWVSAGNGGYCGECMELDVRQSNPDSGDTGNSSEREHVPGSGSSHQGGGGNDEENSPTVAEVYAANREACEEAFKQWEESNVYSFSECGESVPDSQSACSDFAFCVSRGKGSVSQCLANTVCQCYEDASNAESKKGYDLQGIYYDNSLTRRAADTAYKLGIMDQQAHDYWESRNKDEAASQLSVLEASANSDRIWEQYRTCGTMMYKYYQSAYEEPSSSGNSGGSGSNGSGGRSGNSSGNSSHTDPGRNSL